MGQGPRAPRECRAQSVEALLTPEQEHSLTGGNNETRTFLHSIGGRTPTDCCRPSCKTPDTARVLMLGYMNEESLRVTLATRLCHLFQPLERAAVEEGRNLGQHAAIRLRLGRLRQRRRPRPRRSRRTDVPHGRAVLFRGRGTWSRNARRTVPKRSAAARKAVAEKSYTRRLLDGGVDAYGAKVIEEADEVVRAARSRGQAPARSKRRPTCCITSSFSSAAKASS